jgi:hypothetical protein
MTTPATDDADQDESREKKTAGIDDSQLPEDLRPGPDNPLASEDGAVTEAPKADDDDAVPDGEQPAGEPSIG